MLSQNLDSLSHKQCTQYLMHIVLSYEENKQDKKIAWERTSLLCNFILGQSNVTEPWKKGSERVPHEGWEKSGEPRAWCHGDLCPGHINPASSQGHHRGEQGHSGTSC